MRHVLEHDLNIQNVSEKSSQCILATLLAHKKDNKHVLIHFMCARVFSPIATILESEKTLETRLHFRRPAKGLGRDYKWREK